ncbi:hypothetical protein ES706_06510 [subsurface metagenome]
MADLGIGLVVGFTLGYWLGFAVDWVYLERIKEWWKSRKKQKGARG